MARHALHGSPSCGDVCGWWRLGQYTVLCILDGLGHGPEAEAAAEAALAVARNHDAEDLIDLFSQADAALRGTRGVAMGVAVIQGRTGEMRYAAVGNVRALLETDGLRYFDGSPGIIGAGFHKPVPETVKLTRGAMWVLFTDGLRSRVDLSTYGPSQRANVQSLADRILRDWSRGTDDAGVIVYRKT